MLILISKGTLEEILKNHREKFREKLQEKLNKITLSRNIVRNFITASGIYRGINFFKNPRGKSGSNPVEISYNNFRKTVEKTLRAILGWMPDETQEEIPLDFVGIHPGRVSESPYNISELERLGAGRNLIKSA